MRYNKTMKLLVMILMFFSCVLKVSAEKPVDVTDIAMKSLGTSDVDMANLDVKKIAKENLNSINNPVMVAAAIHKIYSSVLKQWPKKQDEEKADYITYKWDILSKKEIRSYKKIILNAAENHSIKVVRLFALISIERAFVEDEEVMFWLIDKLSKPEPDPCLNLLDALNGVAGEKYKHNLDVIVKKCLTSEIVNVKKSTIRYIGYLYYNSETMLPTKLLPDLITCYITTTNSSQCIKALDYILRNKYTAADLFKYYDLIDFFFKKGKKSESGWYSKRKFLKWLKEKKTAQLPLQKIKK